MNPNDPNVFFLLGAQLVFAGGALLLEECRLRPPELRNDLAAQFHELLITSAFLEALTALLPPDQASQKRMPDLLESLRAITTLTEPGLRRQREQR